MGVYQATLVQIGAQSQSVMVTGEPAKNPGVLPESENKSFKVEVQQPAKAIVGRGGIQISLQPSLLAGTSGVSDYMKAYPYGCLEQRTSKAVALGDKRMWDKTMAELPVYLDHDGLAKYFPSSYLEGSDSLTSYLIAIADEAGWVIPEDSLEKMMGGLQGFVAGAKSKSRSYHTSNIGVDLAIRKMAAVEALSRKGKANVAMLGSFDVTPQFWPTSAVIDWLSTLYRMKDIADRETKIREAETTLKARLDFQGTRMGFSTDKTDQFDWLMVSSDVNANRLILTIADSATWADAVGELPKIVRGSIERQTHGHWSTTTGNAWGVLAVKKFSQKYEKETVTGSTVASLDGQKRAVHWQDSPAGKTVYFHWPSEKAGEKLTEKNELEIHQSGTGKPWAIVKSLAAIPLDAPLFSGFRIRKSWNAVERKKSGVWSKGDVVRVHLDLEAQADASWVVVNDPIPAGASILGTGLGNDSSLATQSEKREGWVWPIFEERSFDSFRSYYEFVPKGKWSVEYTIRLNQDGTLNLPSTRTEAMYSPEMFGEIPNAPVQIAE